MSSPQEIVFEGLRLSPMSNQFRIVRDDSYSSSHPFDLEAKVDDKNWKVVLYWDNGEDDYGEIYEAHWSRLGGRCAWTKESLSQFTKRLMIYMGHESPKRTVVSTFGQ